MGHFSKSRRWLRAAAAIALGMALYVVEANAAEAAANAQPEVKYNLVSGEDGCRLYATIDGEDVFIGTDYGLFGVETYDVPEIYDQSDFDGDGVNDALFSSSCMGSSGGSSWMFVSYVGNKRFRKSKVVSIPQNNPYMTAELSKVGGRKVLDFVVIDLGQKVVRKRYGLKDGKIVSLQVPSNRFPAYMSLASIDMESLDGNKSFQFDLNDDGVNERFRSDGTFHYYRNLVLDMNGKTYGFSVGAVFGLGTLHVLKSKTKGMHDIMIEHEVRTIYKWNGSAYVGD